MTACFRRTHLGKLTSDLASSFRSAIERSGVIYEVLCDEDPKQHEVWIDRDFWVMHTKAALIVMLIRLGNRKRSYTI